MQSEHAESRKPKAASTAAVHIQLGLSKPSRMRRGEQVHAHLVHVAVARLYAHAAPANGPLPLDKVPGPWASAKPGRQKNGADGAGAAAAVRGSAEAVEAGQGVEGSTSGSGPEGLDAAALAGFGGAAGAAARLAGARGREAQRCLLAVLLDCMLAPVRFTTLI